MYLKFKLIKGRFSLNRLKYSFLFSLIFFRVSVWVIYVLIFTFIPSLFMLRSSVCILVLFKIYLKIMCFFRWWWKRVIHSIWIFLLVFRLLCAIRLNRWWVWLNFMVWVIFKENVIAPTPTHLFSSLITLNFRA